AGSCAATPERGRPGPRPRAPGADIYSLQIVHVGDGAPAGADLHHLDHRDAQRQTTALEEAVLARNLEGARMLRLAVVDEANLRRRAPHVERQNLVEAALPGQTGGEDGAAGRPRLHQADRQTAPRVPPHDAAAPWH